MKNECSCTCAPPVCVRGVDRVNFNSIIIIIIIIMYWNRSIITDKTIPSNRPDITLMNKTTKNTFLIDIGVPNTHNLAKIITEKQEKYRELANEMCYGGTKYSTSDPDSNIVYGSNTKVTVTKSKET
jgi:hypothetical protein